MAAIARWRTAAKIDRRPLLRRVTTHFGGSVDRIGSERLHPNSISLIYKRLIRRAWEKGLFGEMGENDLEGWLAAALDPGGRGAG